MRIIYKFDDIYSNDIYSKLKGFDPRLLESTVAKILYYFPELKDVKTIMYFACIVKDTNVGANTYPLKYPRSYLEHNNPSLAYACRDYLDIDFAFWFSKIVTEGDEITRVINISHEINHASQYVLNTKLYLYGCIIRFLLINYIPNDLSPIEYDSVRKSKIVSYEIFSKKDVDSFINKFLSNPDIEGNGREFLEVFKSIEICDSYDWKNSVIKLWDKYNIKIEIDKLIKLKNPDFDQSKIIEMYNFANK